MQSSNRLFRFGVFELSTCDATLRKSGVRIHLQAQPMQALQLLLETPGQLVGRDELRRRVWGDETVVDFERGLNYCIKQIREALADDARSPRFIETERGRGYRFLAAVERVDVPGPEGVDRQRPETARELGDAPEPLETASSHASSHASSYASSPSRLLHLRRWIALAGLAVVALSLFLFRDNLVTSSSLADSPTRMKLAVLPFVVLEGERIEPYLVDGLVDELINGLGGLNPKRLGVIARTSSMRYGDGSRSVSEIAAELDVDFVLEGSLRRDGERVRLATQLVEVVEQTHVWSESYRYSLEELSALVTDVVDLARGEEAHPERVEVRLDELVTSALARARRNAPGITFEAQLEEHVVMGDPPRLERAVSNLLDNAAKWTPSGGVVEVSLEQGELRVRDHGPGIDEEDLPFVFDRFYRSKKARQQPGSGLGLAIVRKVAEDHGGRASAENASGGGALMRFALGPAPELAA